MVNDGSENVKRRRQQVSQEDRQTIESANELLDALEQEHRHDLALHLYSSYLLRTLLYRANEKKHFFEVDFFYKSQIKDNWARWPNVNTVIDPQTNKVYEDFVWNDENLNIQPGEISPDALVHSSQMLALEMESCWQHRLKHSASLSDSILDVNCVGIPKLAVDHVLDKLDDLFDVLHRSFASQNKVTVSRKVTEDNQVMIEQVSVDEVAENKQSELSYSDIISVACDMGTDMKETYTKTLELFNDIPSNFDKKLFKLPKHILKKYKRSQLAESQAAKMFSKQQEDFLLLSDLTSDKRLKAVDHRLFKSILKKELTFLKNKKTLLKVRGITHDDSSDELSDYGVDDTSITLHTEEK